MDEDEQLRSLTYTGKQPEAPDESVLLGLFISSTLPPGKGRAEVSDRAGAAATKRLWPRLEVWADVFASAQKTSRNLKERWYA